jgi:hypothetical protein
MKNYLIPILFAFAIGTANADPITHNVDFTCPDTSAISNFGDYVAGYGLEVILGEKLPVYFKTTVWPSGVPSNLTAYKNTATAYDSIQAQVTCSYTSSDSNHASFDLLYFIANGVGGLVTAQTNNNISVSFPVGLI